MAKQENLADQMANALRSASHSMKSCKAAWGWKRPSPQSTLASSFGGNAVQSTQAQELPSTAPSTAAPFALGK